MCPGSDLAACQGKACFARPGSAGDRATSICVCNGGRLYENGVCQAASTGHPCDGPGPCFNGARCRRHNSSVGFRCDCPLGTVGPVCATPGDFPATIVFPTDADDSFDHDSFKGGLEEMLKLRVTSVPLTLTLERGAPTVAVAHYTDQRSADAVKNLAARCDLCFSLGGIEYCGHSPGRVPCTRASKSCPLSCANGGVCLMTKPDCDALESAENDFTEPRCVCRPDNDGRCFVGDRCELALNCSTSPGSCAPAPVYQLNASAICSESVRNPLHYCSDGQPDASKSNDVTLSVEATAGIAGGVLLALLVAAIILYSLGKRRQNRGSIERETVAFSNPLYSDGNGTSSGYADIVPTSEHYASIASGGAIVNPTYNDIGTGSGVVSFDSATPSYLDPQPLSRAAGPGYVDVTPIAGPILNPLYEAGSSGAPDDGYLVTASADINDEFGYLDVTGDEAHAAEYELAGGESAYTYAEDGTVALHSNGREVWGDDDEMDV